MIEIKKDLKKAENLPTLNKNTSFPSLRMDKPSN